MTDPQPPEPETTKTPLSTKPPKRKRGCLRWLFLLGFVSIGGGGHFMSITGSIILWEKGQLDLRVTAAAFDETWTERPVVLLGFGDSIIAGYGASPGKSVFQRLVKNPRGRIL